MTNISKKKINLVIFLLIILIGHLSYVHNAFKVTSDNWFEIHQIDSEQLVLDGFLNLLKNKKNLGLGVYSRNTSIEKDYLNARAYYERKEISNNFKKYKSNFGLQIYFLKFLKFIGFDKLYYFHSITALLMSSVVAFMFFSIKRYFSILTACIIALIFLLSPWIVVSARNLYMLTFLWFLPIALSLHFSNKIFQKNKQFFFFLLLLFIVILLKLLCGFEFSGAIFFSTLAPFFFHAYNQSYSQLLILKKFTAIMAIFILAFLVAVTAHGMKVKKESEKFYEPIIKIVSKRVWTNKDINEVRIEYCENDIKCAEVIYKSLTSNSALIVSKYFLMVDFLPWFYLKISKTDRRLIIDNLIYLNNNFNFENIKIFWNNVSKIKSRTNFKHFQFSISFQNQVC